MTASLQLAHIALRVADLARSRTFYVERLGFVVASSAPGRVDLATAPAAPPILTLLHSPGATAPSRDAAGLFHAALLFPDRAALASWLAFAAAQQFDFEGFSDHGVSEAIYFSDPDGNGLEFYADRPRPAWPFQDGELAMTTRPLAVRELLTLATATPTPLAGARWGHLHLRVTDLARSEAFYRETLGVAVTQRTYPGARFLAADGYHHHLGLNTWGSPRRPQSPDSTGLAYAIFARAGATEDAIVADPDGIGLRIARLAPAR